MSTALILSGGGARAAYQVGVLNAVADILPKEVHNPFPIICGTSAGAINALALAGRTGPLHERMKALDETWSNLESNKIYRSDFLGVFWNGLKILYSFIDRSYSKRAPLALLDNTPLKKLLTELVKFQHIDEAIIKGQLQALGITAMSYFTGKSVTFFQGNKNIEAWKRSRRSGVRVGLSFDHLLASSALPTLFPATKIGKHYYGDGALRLLKPISPALHLGASKVFVIGVSDNPREVPVDETNGHPPSIGEVMGQVLNSVFIDTIEGDLENLRTINRLANEIPEQERIEKGIGDLKPIEVISISPSQPMDKIAEKHIKHLPRTVRLFLYMAGASRRRKGSSVASYLLFEKQFCKELLDLGYQDALAQQDEIKAFFSLN